VTSLPLGRPKSPLPRARPHPDRHPDPSQRHQPRTTGHPGPAPRSRGLGHRLTRPPTASSTSADEQHRTAQHHFRPTNHTGNPIQRGHHISGTRMSPVEQTCETPCDLKDLRTLGGRVVDVGANRPGPGVSRTAEYSAALPLERGEAAVQLRVTRSESGVSSVAAAPRSSAASVAEADGSAKG
jgi:hypothetical protein